MILVSLGRAKARFVGEVLTRVGGVVSGAGPTVVKAKL
ncbi:hypothetical protein DB31_7218 [Hyalangium minutum]|uniref:Uncharacterized protein n=1 Tax=Hyalangium minutum TaxID=394096 RepID=A0A085WJW8_9BACT|nr:hypothetical protein DB31_7218 [Hyalangium minutum]